MAGQGLLLLSLGVNVALCLVSVILSKNFPEARHAVCPCADAELCQPINDTTRKEVFIFSLTNDPSRWQRYDWNKVTTVVKFNKMEPELMCMAHASGARAVVTAFFDRAILTDAEARTKHVAKTLQYVKDNFLDGVNFDFEDEILTNDTKVRDGYTKLVAETQTAFKAALPHSQVSVDVAWSPDYIDLRGYDYKGLADNSDLLFVMAYDEQSQIFGKCVAKANSDIVLTTSGMKKYLDLGVPPSKLVLGIPWYGYNYSCLTLSKDNVCGIKKVPFRGVNCSDAAGNQVNYYTSQALLKNSTTGRLWDESAQSPYFNYKDPISGAVRQVRYDDPQSLRIKYDLVRDLDLRGVGMWNADAVDDGSNDPDVKRQRLEMWAALPTYRN